jgi:hypothetical protein
VDDEGRTLFGEAVRHACRAAGGRTLDRALDEIGWHDALLLEPRLAVSVLFGEMGAATTCASALGAVVGSALGIKAARSAGPVLPALDQWHPPGRMAGEGIVVSGVGTASLVDTATAWVVAGADGGMVAVEVATADLALRPVRGLDPRLGLIEVTGAAVPPVSTQPLGPLDWVEAVALARLAVGHELVGASRAMLELARGHALERIQFGRPIAAFQAVRHRLADALVAIEAADAGMVAAWDQGSPSAAATAKALAGRSARTVSRHCQQVLAGIGFTAEHDFHHYARRVFVLDQLFGTARALTRDLGRELLANRRLPPLPSL